MHQRALRSSSPSFLQMKTVFSMLLAAAAYATVYAVPSDLTSYTFADYVEVRAVYLVASECCRNAAMSSSLTPFLNICR